MATEDLLDFGEIRAAKEHTLAVNRDYISQPRLSNAYMLNKTCHVLLILSLSDCFRSEWTTGNLRQS